MAEEKKSFEELLSSAPLAAKEDTVTLIGVLERSNQPGRFVLALDSGRSLTLEVKAVKDYRVLAGMVGQTVVEIDVARDHVPKEIKEEMLRPLTIAVRDQPAHTGAPDTIFTVPQHDNT